MTHSFIVQVLISESIGHQCVHICHLPLVSQRSLASPLSGQAQMWLFAILCFLHQHLCYIAL